MYMSSVGPSFDRVYVISDLHMGGPTGRQISNTADRLEKFVNAIAKEQGDIALVINGDAVDFLAESSAIHFDPEGALDKLARIYTDPAFSPAWRALEGLVAAGKTLVITLGNHDPELALPEVREWLLHKLTGGDATAVGRIVMSYDGAGYRCNVGGRSVLCTHDNEVDAWNVIDYGRLFREARDANQGRPPVDAWTVNAGTRMVIEVMNGVKRDHPFVDLLKPESEAVIPTLVAINPKLLTQLLDVMHTIPMFDSWERQGRERPLSRSPPLRCHASSPGQNGGSGRPARGSPGRRVVPLAPGEDSSRTRRSTLGRHCAHS